MPVTWPDDVDEVDAGYATLFAVDLIAKVLLVQVLVGLS